MPEITVRPAAGVEFTIHDFVDFITWAVLDADVTNNTPTGFTLSGVASGFGTLVANVTGRFFSYQVIGGDTFLSGGTLDQMVVTLNGAAFATITGPTNIGFLLGAVIDEEERGDPTAIEDYLLGLGWDFQSSDVPFIAPRGTLIGDAVPFELREDDVFTLGAGSDNFYSGAGNDWVDGRGGNDILDGGASRDTLIGGEGNDSLDGGSGNDFLFGGPGDDTYHVRETLDLIDEGSVFPEFGFGGFDTIISHANWFWDVYSVGERLVVAEDAANPSGAGVTVVGGIFANQMIGHSGTDILFGRGGTDIYRAGDGIDYISLSLLGVTDDNAYVGVNGANRVVVDPRASGPVSYDIVFEFESGKDKIDVSAYNYATATQVLARGFNDGAGSSYFALGDGLDYVYLVGLELSDIAAADFIV